MSLSLQQGEKLILCDAFDRVETTDQYRNKPVGEAVINNILRVNPDFKRDNIEIHPVLSSDLAFSASRQFRFIHIDGGHSAEQTHSDLVLAEQHLAPGGVIALDDYQHPAWPGVTEGLDTFMESGTRLRILLDANRHGAYGRKLYLATESSLAGIKPSEATQPPRS